MSTGKRRRVEKRSDLYSRIFLQESFTVVGGNPAKFIKKRELSVGEWGSEGVRELRGQRMI